MKRKRPARSRLFSMTCFMVDKPQLLDFMEYIGGVQELCPSSGRVHWQCFFYVSDAMSMQSVLKRIPKDWLAHVEISKGTLEQNELYCSVGKGQIPADVTGLPGTEFRFGVKPKQGERVDLKVASALAMSGKMLDVNPSTYVRYHRGLHALQLLHMIPYSGPKEVFWYYGPTATGKSLKAFQENPGAYWQSSDAGWFDGYSGQVCIVVDDMEPGTLSVREFNRLTDVYPYHVKVKGTHCPCMARRIIVTSHWHPSEIFSSDRLPEILRRITVLQKFGGEA